MKKCNYTPVIPCKAGTFPAKARIQRSWRVKATVLRLNSIVTKKLACVVFGTLLLVGCNGMGHVVNRPSAPKRPISEGFPPGHDLNPIKPQPKLNNSEVETDQEKDQEKVLVISPNDPQ